MAWLVKNKLTMKYIRRSKQAEIWGSLFYRSETRLCIFRLHNNLRPQKWRLNLIVVSISNDVIFEDVRFSIQMQVYDKWFYSAESCLQRLYHHTSLSEHVFQVFTFEDWKRYQGDTLIRGIGSVPELAWIRNDPQPIEQDCQTSEIDTTFQCTWGKDKDCKFDVNAQVCFFCEMQSYEQRWDD